MHLINPSSPAMQDILVARCETLADAQAMARWILPVLAEWPASAWHFWIVDATDTTALKATKVVGEENPREWRDVDYVPASSMMRCAS
jgi:hypothetical protein